MRNRDESEVQHETNPIIMVKAQDPGARHSGLMALKSSLGSDRAIQRLGNGARYDERMGHGMVWRCFFNSVLDSYYGGWYFLSNGLYSLPVVIKLLDIIEAVHLTS